MSYRIRSVSKTATLAAPSHCVSSPHDEGSNCSRAKDIDARVRLIARKLGKTGCFSRFEAAAARLLRSILGQAIGRLKTAAHVPIAGEPVCCTNAMLIGSLPSPPQPSYQCMAVPSLAASPTPLSVGDASDAVVEAIDALVSSVTESLGNNVDIFA